MSEPILRVTDTTGEVYDDPSEDALFMFIVHRAAHPTTGRVIQHTSYDEIYTALKARLRRAALTSHQGS